MTLEEARERIKELEGALREIMLTVDEPGDNEGDFQTLCGWMHAEAMKALKPTLKEEAKQ